MIMCWCTKKHEFSVKKTADNDIKVFKVVRKRLSDGYCGIYYNFQYDIGETYNYSNNIVPTYYSDGVYTIDYGFHSYNEKSTFVGRLLSLRKEYSFVDAKYHNLNKNVIMTFCKNGTMVDYYDNIKDCNLIKLNCIIPKGSEYHENENGEIVSNRIKIISSEKI